MKIFTLISAVLLSLSSFASHEGEVAIVSNTGERFYVILNKIYENHYPQSVVEFNGSSYDRYDCRIISANRKFHFNKVIIPRADKRITYRIVQHHGRFQLQFVSEEPLFNGSYYPNEYPAPTCPHEHGTHHTRPPVYINHPTTDYDAYSNLLDADGMARLLSIIKRENFSSDRLRVAKNAAQSKRLTVRQIIQIAEVFTFSSDKLEFTKAAYANCVNKADYYEVMQVFTFSSDKQALQEFIDKH